MRLYACVQPALNQIPVQGVAIMGVVWYAITGGDEMTVGRRNHGDFLTKFIGLSALAFGDALNVRFMQAVQFRAFPAWSGLLDELGCLRCVQLYRDGSFKRLNRSSLTDQD